MGGTEIDDTLRVIDRIRDRLPAVPGAAGRPPDQLGGDAALVERQCAEFERRGCAGVDLLAYRATDADPLASCERLAAARSGYLVVAGSVSTVSQIDDLAAAGADGFTIGSAVFDGSFSPRKGQHRVAARDVLEATRRVG